MIEKLQRRDIPSLLELYKELTSFKNSPEKSLEIYDRVENNENYLILVAKENDAVIGTALAIVVDSLSVGGKPFMVIEAVVVKSTFRNRGIAKALFVRLDEFAQAKHCGYAILVSSAGRTNAHKFYENMGFGDAVRGFRKRYQ